MFGLDFSDIVSIIALFSIIAIVVGNRVLGWLQTKGIDLTKLEDIYELAYNVNESVKEIEKVIF